jgi:hypothetical protein
MLLSWLHLLSGSGDGQQFFWVALDNKLFVHVNSLTGNTECFFKTGKAMASGVQEIVLIAKDGTFD